MTAGNSNVLGYSPANRLAAATGAWGSSSYSYDGVGNRLTDITGSITNASIIAPTTNRVTGMTTNGAALRTYSYDTAGNITQDVRPGAETFVYTYNNRNRLAAVTRNGQAYATYVYNALEQLASRNTSAIGGPVGTVHYIYDRDGHLIAEADAATGATTREYIWLPANDNTLGSGNDTLAEALGLANDNTAPDLPLAVVANVNTTPVTYQVHTDHLGRPVRMTDAAKATVWQATYKPWGEVQSLSGTQANNLRFPGQYFQIETNLAYNWHRHYDPVTGRYTQPDPLGLSAGTNRYAYAENSPFIVTDRDGRCPWCLVGGVAGAAVDAYMQWRNTGCINLLQVGGAFLTGAIGGGFGKLAGNMIAAGATMRGMGALEKAAANVLANGVAGAYIGGGAAVLQGSDVRSGVINGLVSGAAASAAETGLVRGGAPELTASGLGGAAGGLLANWLGGPSGRNADCGCPGGGWWSLW